MSTHEERLVSGKLALPSGMALIGRDEEVVLRRSFFIRTPITVESLIKLIRDNGTVLYQSYSMSDSAHIPDQASNQLELYYLFEESASGHWDNYTCQALTCDGDKVILTEDHHSMEFYKRGGTSRDFTRTSVSAEVLVKLIEGR